MPSQASLGFGVNELGIAKANEAQGTADTGHFGD